jgi:hypothetical protein
MRKWQFLVQMSTFKLISGLGCKRGINQTALVQTARSLLVSASTSFLASQLDCRRTNSSHGRKHLYFIYYISIGWQMRKQESLVQTSTFFLKSELGCKSANSSHWWKYLVFAFGRLQSSLLQALDLLFDPTLPPSHRLTLIS